MSADSREAQRSKDQTARQKDLRRNDSGHTVPCRDLRAEMTAGQNSGQAMAQEAVLMQHRQTTKSYKISFKVERTSSKHLTSEPELPGGRMR